MIDELYKKYGELMVQFELLNSRIVQVKQQISQELNSKNQQESSDKIKE